MAQESSAVLPAPPVLQLPASAADGSESRDFGVYLHVPFCRPECGYCDGASVAESDKPGVIKSRFPRLMDKELKAALDALAASGVAARPARSVFFGGGNPTALPSSDIGYMLDAVARGVGLTDDAEITVEAHPDSVDRAYVTALRDMGVTRISLGMHSAMPHVLDTLGCTHERVHVWEAAATAREVGLDLALDLVYGTPGESPDDWQKTLDIALAMEPDHLSAYALVAEPGTKIARAIERGEVDDVDPDVQAEYYLMADQTLEQAGFEWYELNHWARTPDHRSRHQMGYWASADWLGVGPSAHSHVGGVRWWNVNSLGTWADHAEQNVLPIESQEVLDSSAQQMERIMLGVKTREGISLSSLPGADALVTQWNEQGWVDKDALADGRLVLSATGRLLADRLTTELVSLEVSTQQGS